MLTNFGKTLRTLRIQKNELLKDMAQKLNVTVAYLSAVETGNRKVPDEWIPIISKEYKLKLEEIEKLEKAAYENKDAIKLSLTEADEREKNLAYSFARRFKDLNESDVIRIQDILNGLGRN